MRHNATEAVGYQALIEMFDLKVLPPHQISYLGHTRKQVIEENGRITVIYPKKSYQTKDPHSPYAQLEFALKHEGVHLGVIRTLIPHLNVDELTHYIKKTPGGKYTRLLWYLYETITGNKLPIADRTTGSYCLTLDPKIYYTSTPKLQRRYRVKDNFLGPINACCPIVRKTETLTSYIDAQLDAQLKALVEEIDESVLSRAMRYLYTKETMSSWEIERERPSQTRTSRFVDLLRQSGQIKQLTESVLTDLQGRIVDPRFAATGYRDFQNYIGESQGYYREKIHFIPPKPEDVPSLMEGLVQCYERMLASEVHPVIISAVLAFGFVFIHPFEDGNGRLHRFLIHHVFNRTGFTQETIFPVSAVMLKKRKEYDQVLEAYSHPLNQLIRDKELSENGELIVREATKYLYLDIDYTQICEYLFSCVAQTIRSDFQEELHFILFYDEAKQAIQEIVDMPDQKIDLMLQLLAQNRGRLSEVKKKRHFSMLTDDEIAQIEAVYTQMR